MINSKARKQGLLQVSDMLLQVHHVNVEFSSLTDLAEVLKTHDTESDFVRLKVMMMLLHVYIYIYIDMYIYILYIHR